MDAYIIWFLGALVGSVATLAGIAVAAPRRYEAVVSPLVFKASILLTVAAFSWQGGQIFGFGSVKPYISNVEAAALAMAPLTTCAWLATGAGFLLMLSSPLLEILASKCAQHND